MTPEEFADAVSAKLEGINLKSVDLLEIISTIAGRLKDGLGIDDLRWATEQLVKWIADVLPGLTGPEKASVGKIILITAFEQYDQYIPIIGSLLDIGWVDQLEAWVLGWLYDRTAAILIEGAYTKAVLAGDITSSSYERARPETLG